MASPDTVRVVSATSKSTYIDVTGGFPGDVLGPVPVKTAARRVLAYCTEPRSGWGVYDLAGLHARDSGVLNQVTSWSLLLANALNAQVTLNDTAAFDLGRRREFASLLGRLPADVDLHEMADPELEHVVAACAFGFPGVWGPKITKLGAIYRPKSIPVLDGHIAVAFGFGRGAFSEAATQRSLTRRDRIAKVVRALAHAIAAHRHEITALRALVERVVPEIQLIPDLRLVDIVLWTSQDDRLPRRAKQGKRWDERPVGPRTPIDDLAAQSLTMLGPRSE